MLAPWDKDDTREVAKVALTALVTAAATKLGEWAIEELREQLLRSCQGSERELWYAAQKLQRCRLLANLWR